MTQKAMVITGSRKGIGRYLAEYYTNKQWFVYGCSRNESDYFHPNYRHFCLDIADEKQVVKMFSRIRKQKFPLKVLINNAGMASMNRILLTTSKTVRKIFDTNVLGAFLFARESAKLMKKQKCGRIVNISSIAVPLTLEGESVYGGSKAAIEYLTVVMAREFIPFGIHVNSLGLPPIKTDLVKNIPQQVVKDLLSKMIVQRFAKLEEISETIDFFISFSNDMITGQNLYLGGVV